MIAEAPHHWRKISKEPEHDLPALQGEVDADVAVIGGGFTGLAAALHLAGTGAKAVVIEQSRIGQAASGRNNGQVIPHHSKKSASEMAEMLGRDRGDRLNAMVANAASHLFGLIERYRIACDAVSNGWIQACHSAMALERARKFHADWKAFGADVEWLDAAAIRDKIGGGTFLGGWKARHAGHVNPYALAQGLARAALGEGAMIFENTPVTAIQRDGTVWQLRTPRGIVRAKSVLVATNALTGAFWPDLRKALIPVRVYQVASAPLPPDVRWTVLPDGEGVSDTRRDICAFRYDCDGRLAAVGSHTLWHDAANRGRKAVIEKLRRVLPQIPNRPADEYWEGTLAVVPDRLPRLMELAPGVLFAGIYSGRGIALSASWGVAAARLLTGAATAGEMPVPVTPLRLIPGHGIGVQVARFVHPWHRLQDRMDRRL